MTASADADRPGDAAAHLIDCYEGLRAEVLAGASGHRLGLALLLREGMPAWIRTCSTWQAPVARPPRPRTDVTLPAGLQDPMTVLLADMALTAIQEVAR